MVGILRDWRLMHLGDAAVAFGGELRRVVQVEAVNVAVLGLTPILRPPVGDDPKTLCQTLSRCMRFQNSRCWLVVA